MKSGILDEVSACAKIVYARYAKSEITYVARRENIQLTTKKQCVKI